MTYSPTTWVEGVTKLGPTNLNNIEAGIVAATTPPISLSGDDGSSPALTIGSVQATTNRAEIYLASENPVSGGLSTLKVSGTAKGTRTVSDRLNGVNSFVTDDASVVNKTVTGAANNGSGLIRITATTHTFTTGDKVAVYGVTGTTEANGWWTVTVITANTFDLQGSTFTNAYVSGGTATNRPSMYGFFSVVTPSLARGSLTGTAANGDDVAGYVAYNGGTVEANDGYYLGHNSSNSGDEWFTAFSTEAHVGIGLNVGGAISRYGIDFNSASISGGVAIRLGNNTTITSRNAANSSDITMLKLNASNHVEFDCAVEYAEGVDIVFGTSTGTKIGFAASEKLSFYGATPIVQPTTTGTTTGFTAASGTAVLAGSTFTGNTGSAAYTIGDIVNALKKLGLMAA